MERVLWLDYAKGLGVVLVVIGHVVRGFDRSFGLDSITLDTVDKVIYSFHMPLFFFLSGFVFHPRISNRNVFLGWLLKKVFSIGIPYFVWSFIYIIAFSLKSGGGVHLENFVNIFFEPWGQLWFLYALLSLTIFAGCLSFFLKDLAIFVLAILGLVLLLFFKHYSNISYCLSYIVQYLFYFSFGAVFCRLMNRFSVGFSFVFFSGFLFICFQCFLFFSNSEIVKLLCAVFGILFVLGISQFRPFFSEHVKLIGKFSLEIYLVHIFFLQVGYFLYLHFDLNLTVCIFISVALGVWGSMLLTVFHRSVRTDISRRIYELRRIR